LLPQRAAAYIEQHGGKLYISCGVEAIVPKDVGFELVTAQGSHFFSHVVCATPPTVAAKLLRSITHLRHRRADRRPGTAADLHRIPAISMHVYLPHPMIGLHQRFSQWLFDKGQIAGQSGLLAAVISAEAHQD